MHQCSSLQTILFYYLQNDVTVVFAKKMAKMTEICKIKLKIICILKPKY